MERPTISTNRVKLSPEIFVAQYWWFNCRLLSSQMENICTFSDLHLLSESAQHSKNNLWRTISPRLDWFLRCGGIVMVIVMARHVTKRFLLKSWKGPRDDNCWGVWNTNPRLFIFHAWFISSYLQRWIDSLPHLSGHEMIQLWKIKKQIKSVCFPESSTYFMHI